MQFLRHILLFCLLIFIAGSIFALDDVFIGFSAEANGNTREGTAAGGGWTIGFDLNQYAGIGIKTVFSHDLDSMITMEQCALLRFYLPINKHGLFIQAEAGGSILFEDEKSDFVFIGGIATGWRFKIGKNWYIEPFGRGGYPFVWGAGLVTGILIDSLDNGKR